MATYLKDEHKLSLVVACNLVTLPRASYYRKKQHQSDDAEIISEIKTLASKHKRWGCDKMVAYLKNKGKPWNHKRIRRVYIEMGLNISCKPKHHYVKNEPEYLFQPIYKNVCWSLDFMSDALLSGTKFRTMNLIDDYNRKALGIAIDFSMPAVFVTSKLDEWCKVHGYPEMLRTDNGPEFISSHFQEWAEGHGIQLRRIQPGKPAQNGYIERFNRTYRGDILDSNQFTSLQQVQKLSDDWIVEYNTIRPHQSLKNLSPDTFAEKREKQLEKISTKTEG
ncbi:IS3 family transposase [Piscirickettsia salmonis]|uniref:IS3 family transposase n=1 Tax=Piscirickettsia salmonis TaxID=1238 RepID=UPI00249E4066|nr:IS3 family transposase [Piscirickettsia salmonis]